jgi:hypothetical protein
MIKLLCKCGNVEEVESDKPVEHFDFKNCDDGTIAAICKKCNNVVFIKVK